MSFFVKDLPYIFCRTVQINTYEILGHIYYTIDKMVGFQKIGSTSDEKDKLPPIQQEAGQI